MERFGKKGKGERKSNRVKENRGTHLIVPNVHLPEIDSANEPVNIYPF